MCCLYVDHKIKVLASPRLAIWTAALFWRTIIFIFLSHEYPAHEHKLMLITLAGD